MQQGSTVCAARGNYSSWEHRRHYVEFSHLLQSNEAFLVAWISVSPDMPQCLKCLITTAGISNYILNIYHLNHAHALCDGYG